MTTKKWVQEERKECGMAMRDPIALFLPSLKVGGAEKAMVLLANHFSDLGYSVDLLLVKKEGEFVKDVSSGVNVIDFRSRRTLTSLFPLVSYLRRRRPAGLIASMVHCNIVAVLARSLAGVDTRVLIRQENTMSRAARHAPTARGRWIPWLAGRVYPKADAIIAVSNGVADDLSTYLNIPREKIRTIYNPCATEEIARASNQPIDHPWFAPGSPPVIVSMGSLHPQKDQVTLLKAFQRVRSDREARLFIMGEGGERERLTKQAKDLGISDSFSLPGSIRNPFPFLTRSRVFVLSSIWEGHPLVLAEALACGTTIVSTDCPSGPREVLEDGRYGILVPMEDPEALAQGIIRALDSPFPAELLRKRATDFSMENISREYLNMLIG